MDNNILSFLTLGTSFLCVAIALWFAIYLMARSRANHLAFRAVVALLSVVLFYWNALWAVLNPEANTDAVRAMAAIIGLTATHDLTHYLLPMPLRKKFYWIARGVVIFTVVAIALLFNLPQNNYCPPVYICPIESAFPNAIIGGFQFIILLGIFFNLWQIRTSNTWVLSISFFSGIVLAMGTILYGTIGTILHSNLPKFVSACFMLGALVLWGYAVARHQLMIDRRITLFDLPIMVITTASIMGIYLLVTWQLGLPLAQILFIALLAVLTHSAYDFVREFLEGIFRGKERQIRRELRALTQAKIHNSTLKGVLRRALAILCYNLQASSGFVAIKKTNGFEVSASLHSFPVNTILSIQELHLDEVIQPSGVLAEKVAWLAATHQNDDLTAIVGVGPRMGKRVYTMDELQWLEEIADEIGILIFRSMLNGKISQEEPEQVADKLGLEEIQSKQLFPVLAYTPTSDQIKHVEESFRYIYDYSRLGRSPLVAWFDIDGENHIESGKLVQENILTILETMRPDKNLPSEPYPNEWHNYIILHDAYVEDLPAREIMAKLYISAGTYYRKRRKALRGITRAILEITGIPT